MLRELSHMDRITQLQDEIQQLLTIISSSIAYLTSRAKLRAGQRRPNKKELVTDLIVKAKQVEYLITSLPQREPEEEQATRLQILDDQMTVVNEEFLQAVVRSKDLHAQITDTLRLMLEDNKLQIPPS
ncbi:hypothetical protein B0H12DRAFT_1205734 [Mycena haematopus]|nr:hypothetical protein B0H12DRAFT_1205734 [Mycena haematopus]